MGLELLFAIVCWAGIFLWVWFYQRYWEMVFQRDPDFERWCNTVPLVAAIRCPPGTRARALQAMEEALGPRAEILNFAGRRPWPLYRYQITLGTLGDEIITVHVLGSIPDRGRGRRAPTLDDLIAEAADPFGEQPLSLWLHGQFFDDGRYRRGAYRSHMGWIGEVWGDEEPSFSPRPMIGQPRWLRASP